MTLVETANKLDLKLNHHYSWIDPEVAKKSFENGSLSELDYLAGLFYHPNHSLYPEESDRLWGELIDS
jgi:hypothetical protein